MSAALVASVRALAIVVSLLDVVRVVDVVSLLLQV